MRGALAILAALGIGGCGYRPVQGTTPDGARLHVVLATSNVADAVATDEVLAGVRDELSRLGALEAGDGYPRVEVEVLRADEAAEGVAAVPNADGRLLPTSRATRVGIVARAWVSRRPSADPERDTGDVRSLESVAAAGDARAASFRHTDALRAAGRRVGRRLADRVLGLPAATDE